jgi:hypothetical protein
MLGISCGSKLPARSQGPENRSFLQNNRLHKVSYNSTPNGTEPTFYRNLRAISFNKYSCAYKADKAYATNNNYREYIGSSITPEMTHGLLLLLLR